MTKEERKEWHNNHKVDKYIQQQKHIEYCIKKGILYKTNYQLLMGANFKEEYYNKADVLKLPRHNGGHINGKKML
tara:strand:- start:107 stop:331 length:225 start_codon:yes stop_codon:yes gene_type:complete